MSERKPMHGTGKAAGCDHLKLGNFCKLLPGCKTWAEECGITEQCQAEEVASLLGAADSVMHDNGGDSNDSEIPAAYTFFAQFVDHDITLDTTSKLHQKALSDNEVNKLPNLRSPSLDLDCVYGFGPDASPFLYDQNQPGRLLTGSVVNGVENPNDVPRNTNGRALIGDPRNDENIFVSQLQLLFLRFHNKHIVGRTFEDAQREVRYYYQWVVLYDFLWRVCDPDIYGFAIKKIEANARKNSAWKYPFCNIVDDCHRICMPVEFSTAAYRFGHTMVRSEYPVNADYPVVELFDERFGTLGFGQVPPELTVDWRYLLQVDPCHPYAKSKAMDHLLANELIVMPDPIVGKNASANERSLAFRNLLRGYVMGLPSGQTVAEKLAKKGYPIKLPQNLKWGDDDIDQWRCLDKAWRSKLEKHTPLFLYVLREAATIGKGKKLGPVGSAILMEVFGTLYVHCNTFFKEKDWKPDPCISGRYMTLADIVRYVNR